MNEKEIEKLIHMNQRLNLVLGYAIGFIMPYGQTLEGNDLEKYRWLCNAIDNLCYLDKPLPKIA